MRFKYLAALICGSVQFSRAAVIFDDAVLVNGFSDSGGQVLTLSQSLPSGEGLFAISVDSQNGSQYLFSYQGIAEEYALFQAQPGQLFTPSFVRGTLPFISNNGLQGAGSLLIAFGETVFLAYWDDRDFDGIADYSDNYGWVAVTPTLSSELEVVDSVTALEAGIVVGTSITVPEPHTGVLLLGFFALVGWRRQRHKA